jgi:hypothetical protein
MTEQTFPGIRRLGVDNWAPEDFERERQWRIECKKVHDHNEAEFEALGWVIHKHRPRCSRDHLRHSSTAINTERGLSLPVKEAYALINSENPGLLLEYPPKPEYPPSSFGLFQIGEVEIKPMEMPSGLVFYTDYGRS